MRLPASLIVAALFTYAVNGQTVYMAGDSTMARGGGGSAAPGTDGKYCSYVLRIYDAHIFL